MLPILGRYGEAGVRNIGTLAQRPNADASLFNLPFFATDTLQLFNCVQTGQAPDTFTWELISSGASSSGNQFGTLAARPVASAANAGAFYYANDIGEFFQNVQSTAGVYQWLLYQGDSVPSQLTTWANQVTWAINASTGSDTNPGGSFTPLATYAEWRRRILAAGGLASNLGNVTVTWGTNAPESDPVNRTGIHVPDGTALIFQGTATAKYSSTVGVVTPKAGNVWWSFTDPALPVSWTASGLIDVRGRVTSGPRAGTLFFPAFDLGGKAARVSSPILPVLTYPFNFSYTYPTITAGDAYSIETLTTMACFVPGGDDAINDTSGTANPRFFIKDFDLSATTFQNVFFPGTTGSYVGFIGCILGQFQSLADYFFGCAIVNGVGTGGMYPRCAGGYVTAAGSIEMYAGGTIELENFLAQGELQGGPGQGNFNAIGDVGVFNAAFIELDGGSIWNQAGAFKLVGTSGAAEGIAITNGLLIYGTAQPTLTGSVTDTVINAVTKTWATIPYLDQTTGSGIIKNNASQRAQGSVTLNGATPVPVAVASIQATDIVVLMRTSANAGTVGFFPTCVITAGTGFTVTGAALDTSIYAWKLQKG